MSDFSFRSVLFLSLALACSDTLATDTKPVAQPYAPDPNKVVRYAFEVAETSFDPQKVSDVYSIIITSSVFDSPLVYDYLARPLKLIPATLAAMPEVSADQKTITLRVKPGIYFADDPAFNGNKRELVAEDYVYSLKRLMDPRISAPGLGEVEDVIVGAAEYTAKARKVNKLDYDAPLEGLRALDRYTWQIRLTKPKFTFLYNLADCHITCAVAREVVEKYGDDIGAHPVGTGAFKLAAWKRSSNINLVANPNFREEYWDAQPAADDVAGRALLAKMKGQRLPMVGRIEVSIIDEQQPRWLSFLNNEHDLLFRMGPEFANVGVPNNRLAPNLKKRGIQMAQIPALDLTFAYFNMDDPLIGGYTPEKVALRRAISLSYMAQDEINIIWKGQAILAQAPYSPGVAGYDANFRTTGNEYNPAKANALLDLYGYKDIDGDGYREMPDGRPLVIKYNSLPDARFKLFDELWKRSMDDIGIKMTVRKGKFQELLKESNAGKLMMWFLSGSATAPDADTWLSMLYGPNAGSKGNRANFKLPAYDDAYRRAELLPDGPERTKLYQEMARLTIAYAPIKINTHRVITDMWYPYLIGYVRPPLQTQTWWKFVDVELANQKAFEAAK